MSVDMATSSTFRLLLEGMTHFNLEWNKFRNYNTSVYLQKSCFIKHRCTSPFYFSKLQWWSNIHWNKTQSKVTKKFFIRRYWCFFFFLWRWDFYPLKVKTANFNILSMLFISFHLLGKSLNNILLEILQP